MRLPPSPPYDPHSGARDLAAAILTASSFPDISAVCDSVDAFLRRHPPDHCRPFFSFALPALLSRLFGLGDPPSPAWIDLPDPSLSSLLLDLLVPAGPLLSRIHAADSRSLLRFSFPVDRLPKWISTLLLHHDGHYPFDPSDICQLLKSRTESVEGALQLHLNVFEYYLFWFVYYPLHKGACKSLDAATSLRKAGVFCLERWAASRPSGKQQAEQRTGCRLYLRLLDTYLRAFVPWSCLGHGRAYRSSLLNYSMEFQDSPSFLQAEFVMRTIVSFWMLDNDFAPLSVNSGETPGVSFATLKALGKVPPSADLGEPLQLVINYLNGGSSCPSKEFNPAFALSLGSLSTLVQRPLYRFIARTFLFFPVGSPIENLSQVFSMWMSYLEPWKARLRYWSEHDPADVWNEHPKEWNEKGKASCISNCTYTSLWSTYVASNFLFYSLLVIHFLSFAHRFLHDNTDLIIQMTLKVSDILTSSTELSDFLKKINDACYLKQDSMPSFMFEGAYNCISSICEKLQDWEDGLFEGNGDSTFQYENHNCKINLFTDNESGACHLLQLLILRAEHEIAVHPGDRKAKTLEDLESLKAKVGILFDDSFSSIRSPAPGKGQLPTSQNRQEEVFTPKYPGVGKHRWADAKCQGDSMRSPISENEIAWLARYLIRLSELLNALFGLNGNGDKHSSSPTFVKAQQVKRDTLEDAESSRVWMLLFLLGTWMALLFQLATRFIRGRGWRINLRMLASKKVLTLLLAYVTFCFIRKRFWCCS